MVLNSPEDAMPWVGLYVAVASLVCTLAMAADAFQGFRHWKLWFPCRFFTVNAASITLMAITMKLPVDLNTNTNSYFYDPKLIGNIFLVTMLANFLPSLGHMDDKELVLNIIALGTLLITIIVNVCIQTFTKKPYLVPIWSVFLILSLPWPFSIALSVSTSKRILKHQYKESYKLPSNSEYIKFSHKELVHHVKRHWMMAETGNPQFMIACSPICNASGVLCALFFAVTSPSIVLSLGKFVGKSDYGWSVNIISSVQLIGIVVGSIAPIFRCLTAISYFNLSKKWSMSYLNMFRVEMYWIQRLQQWKNSHAHSYIPGRHCKMIFHSFKYIALNVCVTLQITVVVMCKMICIIPRSLLILFSCCVVLCNSFWKRYQNDPTESSNNMRLEMEEYASYVLQVDEEAKISKRLLRNTLNNFNKLLQDYEKKEPRHLMKLLKKSTGFIGVVEFDNNQVPPLHPDEIHICWSLVTITLTTVALALPNIANGHVKELLASVKEGLHLVNHIEEALNSNEQFETRKAAIRVWTEVEVYRKWLQIDVQKKAREGKPSREILQWLGDETIKIVIKFKRSKKGSLNQSFYKFIAATCMYRISQSILLHCNEQKDWPEDEEVFEWISTIIADILLACFTNLPRVITMKCHHKTLRKRIESITTAAMLLGKSKKILNIIEWRQLPNFDIESMAYIDKWQAILKDEICASSAGNESLMLNIV